MIKPGQVYLDNRFRWSSPDAGRMVYIVQCSNEQTNDGRDLWETICFQESFGGYLDKSFVAGELLQMKYLGHIDDLENVCLNYRRFDRTVGFWWGAFVGIVFSGIINVLHIWGVF